MKLRDIGNWSQRLRGTVPKEELSRIVMLVWFYTLGGGFLTSQPDAAEHNFKSDGGGKQSDECHMYPYTVSLIKRSFDRNPLMSHSDFFGKR